MLPKRSRRPVNPDTEYQAADRAALLDAGIGLLVQLGPTTFSASFRISHGPKYPIALIRSMVRRGLLEPTLGDETVVQITRRGRSIVRMIKRRKQIEKLKKELSR